MATVLLIEDDLGTLELVAMLFEHTGHKVKCALGGAQGIALAATPPPPDLVVCDIRMPEIDGFEVARQLRRLPQGGHFVMVAITADLSPEVERAALAAGFNTIMGKIPLLNDVAETVASIDRKLTEATGKGVR